MTNVNSSRNMSFLVPALFWATFIVPVLYGFFFSTYSECCFSASEQWKVYLSAPVILYFAIFLVAIIAVWRIMTKRISDYDGSDESYKTAVSSFNTITIFTMFAPVAGGFLYPIAANAAASASFSTTGEP